MMMCVYARARAYPRVDVDDHAWSSPPDSIVRVPDTFR